MNTRPRREFLKGLLALPLLGAPALASAAGAAVREYDLSIFPVAGFRYYGGPELLDHLQPDVPLRLVPEPGNPYDQRAVRIEAFGRHIGYVPRADNAPVHRLLVQEAPLQARVFTAPARRPGVDSVMVAVSLGIGGMTSEATPARLPAAAPRLRGNRLSGAIQLKREAH